MKKCLRISVLFRTSYAYNVFKVLNEDLFFFLIISAFSLRPHFSNQVHLRAIRKSNHKVVTLSTLYFHQIWPVVNLLRENFTTNVVNQNVSGSYFEHIYLLIPSIKTSNSARLTWTPTNNIYFAGRKMSTWNLS